MFKIKNKKRILRFLYSFLMFSLVTNMSFLGVFFVANEASADINYNYILKGQQKNGDFTSGNICSGGGGCYSEGESVPVKLKISGLEVDTLYSVVVGHDYKNSDGVIGYDSFNDPSSWDNSADSLSFSDITMSSDELEKTYTLNFTATSETVKLKWLALLGDNASYFSDGANLHFYLVSGIDEENVGKKDVPIKVSDTESDEEYFWESDDWGECNDDSSPGFSSRDVYCLNDDEEEVEDSFCESDLKPASEKICYQEFLCQDIEDFSLENTSWNISEYNQYCQSWDENFDCTSWDPEDSVSPYYSESIVNNVCTFSCASGYEWSEDEEACLVVDLGECGNNIIDDDEECDNSTFPDGYSSDNFTCSQTCEIEEVAPSCGLSEDDYDYVFNFGNVILVTNGAGGNPSYSNEITTNISEGNYKVTLQSYDGYYDRIAVNDQPNESYQYYF